MDKDNGLRENEAENGVFTNNFLQKLHDTMHKIKECEKEDPCSEKIERYIADCLGEDAVEMYKRGERDFLSPEAVAFVDSMVREVKQLNESGEYDGASDADVQPESEDETAEEEQKMPEMKLELTPELSEKMQSVMIKARNERGGGMTEEQMNECFVTLFGRDAAERIKRGERDFLDPAIASFVEYMANRVKLMNKMRRYMQNDD